jgi:hypothetical protein
MPRRPGIWARIAADGSTARTLRPNQSLNAVANTPVPAPMSTTVMPGEAELPPDSLAPVREPVARDLADRLIGRRGLIVVADPGHPFTSALPVTSAIPAVCLAGIISSLEP